MERMRKLRELKGLLQRDVAEHLGIDRTTYVKYETGKSEPDMNTLIRLANYYDVSVDELLGRNAPSKKGVRIPVFGNVAAGIPIDAITDIEDFEEIPEEMANSGEYAALRIHGNSMEPRMQDGDVVIVRIQDTVESGDIAVVMVNGDTATCKKIKKTPEGILLISTNPNYEPMFYSNREIEQLPLRIFGKVVELRAKY